MLWVDSPTEEKFQVYKTPAVHCTHAHPSNSQMISLSSPLPLL